METQNLRYDTMSFTVCIMGPRSGLQFGHGPSQHIEAEAGVRRDESVPVSQFECVSGLSV